MKVYENIKEFIESECVVGEKEKAFIDDLRYVYRKKYGFRERELEGISIIRFIKTYVPVTCCMYKKERMLVLGISLKNPPEILVGKKVEEKKDLYEKLDQFVREKCVISEYDRIRAKDLFNEFLEYCERKNVKKMQELAFLRRICKINKDIYFTTNSYNNRVLHGITLKELECKNIYRFIDEMLEVGDDKKASSEKLKKEFHIFAYRDKNQTQYDSTQEFNADFYRACMNKNIDIKKARFNEIENGERKTRRGFIGIGLKEENA